MATRLELHEILCEILGTRNVYFQPPESVKMKYPAIVYEKNNMSIKFADNNPYVYEKRYKVTVIDKNPDSVFPHMIIKLPKCSFDRHYIADNLNHDVFNLYF